MMKLFESTMSSRGKQSLHKLIRGMACVSTDSGGRQSFHLLLKTNPLQENDKKTKIKFKEQKELFGSEKILL